MNMQRYGPPPLYPNARLPGLNVLLPTGASYGYHVGGWGKPPIDAFGRPLYGGDPFGTPEAPTGVEEEGEDLYGLSSGAAAGGMITSDRKAIAKKNRGGLPNAFGDGDDYSEGEEESSEEESSDEEMEESEEEGEMEAPPAGSIGLRVRNGRGDGAAA
jgi:splicing factor 3B subunit 2